MQVKKFEAKTMKEALEMIKAQLGPEAIILSARDNSKSYGLMGQKSVEVTAAISDDVLRKKVLAEQKLSASNRDRYQQSAARVQRQFINSSVENQKSPVQEKLPPSRALIPRPPTQQRYVDISDTESAPLVANAANRSIGYEQNPQVAKARIKNAARLAFEAGLETMPISRPFAQPTSSPEQQEIYSLKNEIQNLKNLVEKFSQVPQSFLNLHPGADRGIPFELSSTYEKMMRAGFSEDNTLEILKEIRKSFIAADYKKPAHVEAWLVKFLLDNLTVVENRTRGFYHVFLGPNGQGKTSSAVKFAANLVIQEKKKVAIVTLDAMKVGAAEQLKIYAQILNIPFAIVKRGQDWVLLEDKLRHFDHVLVDAPGTNLKTNEELKWLQDLLPPLKENGRTLHYVQSVLAKDEDAFEIAGRYHGLNFQDTIFTGLDESTQHGLIYNFQKKFGVPLHSFGIGPQMPEDFEAASKERVVDLIFKISKLKKGKVGV